MPAPIQTELDGRTTRAKAAGIRSTVVPIKIGDRAEPGQELAFQRAFLSIHVDSQRGAIDYLPLGIGVAEKGIAALRERNLSVTNCAVNDYCEGDRARLTQRTLLGTKGFLMRCSRELDATPRNDLHIWCTMHFVGFFTI